MRALEAGLLAIIALTLSGCAGAYTELRKVDDQTYILTRTKQGFFRTYGTVFVCKPAGDTLSCQEIDSP